MEFNGERVKTEQKEKQPKLRLMITRHAERLPSGELSPEGIESSKKKGNQIEAGVFKGYASSDKSKRTYFTHQLAAEEAGIESPIRAESEKELADKLYRTSTVEGISYDILKPDLADRLGKVVDLIEEATLKELGMSTARDEHGKLMKKTSDLPIDEQTRIAKIRQKNQQIGFRHVMNNEPELSHRLAIGLAHQLVEELNISKRYFDVRDRQRPLQDDVILNTATHGLFTESLLREAGYYKNTAGKNQTIEDFEDEKFGGFMNPADSIYLEIDNPREVPSEIPVTFEGEGRPEPGSVFIDLEKLKKLAEEYEMLIKGDVKVSAN